MVSSLCVTGPRDPLYVRFQKEWPTLQRNEGDFNLWEWPQDPTSYTYQRASDVRVWLQNAMDGGLFAENRDDYRELMECASIYLGAQVEICIMCEIISSHMHVKMCS